MYVFLYSLYGYIGVHSRECFNELMLITRHVLVMSTRISLLAIHNDVLKQVIELLKNSSSIGITKSNLSTLFHAFSLSNQYQPHPHFPKSKPKAAITPFILMCTVYVHVPIQHHFSYSQSELPTISFKTLLCYCTADKKNIAHQRNG